MDNLSSTYSILDTLRTVEFRLGLKGYNVDEVDEYLEKAALEAEQVQERLRTANERLGNATERVAQLEDQLQQSPADRTVALEPPGSDAPPPATGPLPSESAVTSDALQRTLFLAQKFVEQTKRESEAEAAKVVSEAEDRARTLLAQAEERARRLASEAEERLRDEVARLEEARARLASDVAAMSGHLDDQRTRIRASLTEMLRWVDERIAVPAPSEAEPAAGVAASAQPEKAGALAAAGTGTTRPQAASSQSGAPERQPAVGARAHASAPSSERAQARLGAGSSLASGGLFDSGREETTGSPPRRLGE